MYVGGKAAKAEDHMDLDHTGHQTVADHHNWGGVDDPQGKVAATRMWRFRTTALMCDDVG